MRKIFSVKQVMILSTIGLLIVVLTSSIGSKYVGNISSILSIQYLMILPIIYYLQRTRENYVKNEKYTKVHGYNKLKRRVLSSTAVGLFCAMLISIAYGWIITSMLVLLVVLCLSLAFYTTAFIGENTIVVHNTVITIDEVESIHKIDIFMCTQLELKVSGMKYNVECGTKLLCESIYNEIGNKKV